MSLIWFLIEIKLFWKRMWQSAMSKIARSDSKCQKGIFSEWIGILNFFIGVHFEIEQAIF